LAPDRVNIYDCTEFNDAFREIDIACDIAFLAMDLDFNHRTAEATTLVEQVAEKSGDPAMPFLINYYKCYRACVRGKVEALTSTEEEVDEVERLISQKKARRYYQLAVQTAIAGSTPLVVVVMGDVGSGKSTLASGLAAATGWSCINSDALRKDLAGVPRFTRGTPKQRAQLYSQEMTKRVYQLLRESALEKLRQGESLILDATFSKTQFRDELNDCLADERFKVIWIEAIALKPTRLSRLQSREHQKDVISDARAEDFLDREFSYEPPTELSDSQFFLQSTEIDPDYVLFMALTSLSKRLAANND
jgi:predicted kinase